MSQDKTRPVPFEALCTVIEEHIGEVIDDEEFVALADAIADALGVEKPEPIAA